MSHQPFQTEELLAFLLGEVADERRDEIRALSASPEVSRELERLAVLLSDLSTIGDRLSTLSVSDAQLARLNGMLGSKRTNVLAEAARRVREVVCTVVFDSFRAPELAVGFRGGASQRLVRFEWDEGQVDVRVSADQSGDDRYWITGEVRGGGVSGLSLREVGASEESRAEVSSDGRFEVCVEPGEYEVRLESEENVVVVPLPRIGARDV